MTLAAADPQPLIRFDKSQRAFFADESRIVAANFHRQKGKDFTAAAKAVNSAIGEDGKDWFIVGMNQGQADETFNKCKKVVAAFKELLKIRFGTDRVVEEEEEFTDYDATIDEAFVCRRRILRMPNDARVVSLPGRNPDGLAGRTGNMIWTEFGLYPNGGYEHWGTLFPIITRGGYRIVIISTPRGKNTKFYEVMQNADGDYSTHTCDIYKSVYEEGYQLFDAKSQPYPQSTRAEQEAAIAAFRRLYKDETKWPREYECQFNGDLSKLVTWAEIERAAELGRKRPFNYLRVEKDDLTPKTLDLIDLEGRAFDVGWDVARTGDISAISVNVASDTQPKHLRAVIAMHNCSFGLQRAWVMSIMDRSRRSLGAGDATGLGMDSNETLHLKYGRRWRPVNFSGGGKREVISALKTGFSDGTQTLPPLDGAHKLVALDVYAIEKDDTGTTLTVSEGDNALLPESHCDIAYAIGLARIAGATGVRPKASAPLARKPVGL